MLMKTRKMQLLPALVVLLALFFVGAASAQITPLGDSYTNTADATTNYGAKTSLDVDGASQITYIQFPLSSIPSGATVSGATLKLYVNTVTTAGSFNVDYVNSAWIESTIDASNAPPLGTTIVSNVNITTADKNQYILIDVTPAVQAWISGSETNNGIALVANSTFNATFDSKESTTTSHPPELDIAYAGGDGTITGVTTASGSGLTGGGTSGALNLSLTNACAANRVLEWNGSSWICAEVGTGTVTTVNSGTGLTGGPITGSGTLSINTAVVPQLAAANTFTGNQTVNGNLSATGVVTGSGFEIGSNLFGYGSYANQNASLGFGGNTTMTGTGNTAVGSESLQSNTTGTLNTVVGVTAMEVNTTGIQNTAVGVNSLFGNTTGWDNTALGLDSLAQNTTGSGNVGVGFQALGTSTTGSFNTAAGLSAGLTSNATATTGSNNTFIGAYSSPGTQTTLTNATAIGANAEVGQSNALILGSINGVNNATADAYVGIGTTAPRTKLEVDANANSALAPTLTLTNNGGLGQVSLDFNTYRPSATGTYNPASRIWVADANNNSDNIYFQSNIGGAANNGLQTNLTILSSGNVGVGTATPGATIDVVGNATNTTPVLRLFAELNSNLIVGQDNFEGAANVFRVSSSGEVFADGGYQSSGADFAESMAVAGARTQYEPGDVLAVEIHSGRRLTLATAAYSTRVAGVYSTKPGLLATPHHIDDPAIANEVPLAVVGIVPCKASAENGAIIPGDLLVSSHTPGHVMKGKNQKRMLGAVVGKALEPLPKGTGTILVLVTLQ
jgi:trimeric autotransporter adhesin